MSERHNPPIEFPDRLRIARTARGLLQSELGDLLERAQMTVSRWETGESVPQRRSDVERLADVLDVDVDWLDPGASIRSKCSDFVAA
jgi:transcriptional regulator with XRE-family HTH domain